MYRIENKIELLRGNNIVINKHLQICHPKLQDIYDYEEESYFRLLSSLLATPYDYKVALWDSGTDYTKVEPHILFFEIVSKIPVEKTSILFGNFNFCDCVLAKSRENDQIILVNKKNGCIIDVSIYSIINNYLRLMHSITKEDPMPSNETTKLYFIERDRKLQERHKNDPYVSHLFNAISSLVNSIGFKYDYQSIWNLPIFQFYDSLSRINHIRYCDNVLTGIYTGNVDAAKVNTDSINWTAKL